MIVQALCMRGLHVNASTLRVATGCMCIAHAWAAKLVLAALRHEDHVSSQARAISRKRLRQVSQPSQETIMASASPSFAQFPPSTPNPSHDAAAHAPAEPKRGLLGRLFEALIDARQREAEEHMAHLLARSGGKLTDSLEGEADYTFLGR
jgi:hypothetical protein